MFISTKENQMLNFKPEIQALSADELFILSELKTNLKNKTNFQTQQIFDQFDYQVYLLASKRDCYKFEITKSFQDVIYYFTNSQHHKVMFDYAKEEFEEITQKLNNHAWMRYPLTIALYEFFENELRNVKLNLHGGKRENAGRKGICKTKIKKTISVRLPVHTISNLDALEGIRSEHINNAINQYLLQF